MNRKGLKLHSKKAQSDQVKPEEEERWASPKSSHYLQYEESPRSLADGLEAGTLFGY
jgi:hypothetical protein